MVRGRYSQALQVRGTWYVGATAKPCRYVDTSWLFSGARLWKGAGYGYGVQGTGCKVRGTGCGVRGTGYRVRGTGYGVQGTGYRVQGTRYGVRGTGYGVQGTGYRVQGTGYGVRGTGLAGGAHLEGRYVVGKHLTWQWGTPRGQGRVTWYVVHGTW